EQQRSKGRSAGTYAGEDAAWNTVSGGPHSQFIGYEVLEAVSPVRAWRPLPEGRMGLVLEQTPFYAESGGQVGDQGQITGAPGVWRVVDVQKDGDRIVHICEGVGGKTPPTPTPAAVTAMVDATRRQRTTLNHSATHLMHAALRKELGAHVHQSGSVVHPDYLRFDYTHFERPTPEQLEAVERRVNASIRGNKTLNVYQSGYDAAVAAGVTALFGEKYGDTVRVVEMGEYSRELCGGCHVRATGDIGVFRIISESSIAAGVRRIVAITGESVENHMRQETRIVDAFREQLNVAPEELPARLMQVLEERRTLERELKAMRRGNVGGDAESLLAKAHTVQGITVLAALVEIDSMDELRGLADALRQKMKSGIAVIGSLINNKASLLCAITDDLVRRNLKAGDIVNMVAALAEGRGGGPPHMATAGAKNPAKLPFAIEQAPGLIEGHINSAGL
ncbi:MAG: DHHA1 domain-containing protein, partial [Deltaproteobacteria bacterium]|nr:DHHA1 domain-containing protein [Deltaproteobacteria bacterium]